LSEAQSASGHPPSGDIRSILVMRPNAIGDFMFALPALHALRHRYPDARIVFLGKQWHWEFLRDRPVPIDEVRVMPPFPGITAPADLPLELDAKRFVTALRERQFDLAVQMYGGGRYANPFIQELGAATSIGMKAPDATPLDRWIPYSALANRRLELLQVAALVDAAPSS
jgi:ADP-heptose:LPS heptosyltransferase